MKNIIFLPMGEPHRRAERNYKKKPRLVFSLPFFLVFFFFLFVYFSSGVKFQSKDGGSNE